MKQLLSIINIILVSVFFMFSCSSHKTILELDNHNVLIERELKIRAIFNKSNYRVLTIRDTVTSNGILLYRNKKKERKKSMYLFLSKEVEIKFTIDNGKKQEKIKYLKNNKKVIIEYNKIGFFKKRFVQYLEVRNKF